MNTDPAATIERKPAALIALDELAFERIYGAEHLDAIRQRVRLLAPPCRASELKALSRGLAEAEVLFSGWGAPVLDAELLGRMPRLRIVFYGAGTIRYFVTDEMWRRGIRVTTAAAVNAEAVANYTAGVVLFALKQGFGLSRFVRERRAYSPGRPLVPGVPGGVVALISFGATARAALRKLRPFGVRFMVYDPIVAAEEIRAAGAEPVSLERAFAEAHVVSLHAPLLAQTRGMIGRELLASMRRDATFINTARGALVRELELIDVLRSRGDLTAVLDVTDPEPPRPDSPLYVLPNVVLTPHVAGTADGESRQLGAFVVAELDRWLRGEPLQGEVTAERSSLLA